MRQSDRQKGKTRKPLTIIRRRSVVAFTILIAASCVVMAFAARAYNNRSAAVPASQVAAQSRPDLLVKLSRQFVADRFRRQLGSRFLVKGRELSALNGTLTISGQSQPIRIVRVQENDGERLAIALGNQPASLTWDSKDGAMAAGNIPSGPQRSLIERIALDSPDQFVLAQLRGASYRTVANHVVPKGADEIEDYSGPSWDVTLISEPAAQSGGKFLSDSRLYYINTSTGLLDRIISKEGGQTVVAEVSGWVEQKGEKLPTRITWLEDGQPVMELSLKGASHGPRE